MPTTVAAPPQVVPQSAVAVGKRRVVAATASGGARHAFAHAATPSPVSSSVTVSIGVQPVTVWAWAVPLDKTCTAGVVQATTPAAAAAFLRAVRRSVAPPGRSWTSVSFHRPLLGHHRAWSDGDASSASNRVSGGMAVRSGRDRRSGATERAVRDERAGERDDSVTRRRGVNGELVDDGCGHVGRRRPAARTSPTAPGRTRTAAAARRAAAARARHRATGAAARPAPRRAAGADRAALARQAVASVAVAELAARAEILEPLDQQIEQLGLGVGLEQRVRGAPRPPSRFPPRRARPCSGAPSPTHRRTSAATRCGRGGG